MFKHLIFNINITIERHMVFKHVIELFNITMGRHIVV